MKQRKGNTEMLVNPIKNGTVLDHITAGRGMELYRILKLNELECPVAIITNAYSLKMGCKDIIKIDGEAPLDLNVIGYVDPGVTVSIIRDGDVAQRIHLKLPQQITGVIRCQKPPVHHLHRAGTAPHVPPGRSQRACISVHILRV